MGKKNLNDFFVMADLEISQQQQKNNNFKLKNNEIGRLVLLHLVGFFFLYFGYHIQGY